MSCMKSKPRIYIAGPMRGYPRLNFDAFFNAERRYKRAGFLVVNPARFDCKLGYDARKRRSSSNWKTLPKGFPLKQCIANDLRQLLRCTHIFMLPGWRCSVGARAEYAVAQWLGLRTFGFDVNSVNKHIC